MLNNLSQAAIVVFSITTAILYFLGIEFYVGYLGFWALDESMFPAPFHRLVVYGTYVIRQWINAYSFNIIILGFGIAYFIFFCFHKAGRFICKWRKQVIVQAGNTRQVNQCEQNTDKFLNDSNYVISILLVSFVLIAALSFLSLAGDISASQYGKSAGLEQKQRFDGDTASRTGVYSRKSTVDILNGKSGEYGVVMCSTDQCVLYANGTRSIVPVGRINKIQSNYIPKQQ